MTRLDTRRFEMLARVREFGAAHPEIFAPGTRPGDLLAAVNAVVDELSAQYTAQEAGAGVARTGASNRARVRERVRDGLEAMRRSAREISEEVSGIDSQFELPRSNRDQAVLGAARTFVANAEALKPMFARQMLGAEFFAAFEADIAAFEEALSVQRRGREARVSATAAIEKAIARGVRTVRSLNTLMLNRFSEGTAVLAAWKSACRIHSPNVRGSAPAAEAAHPTPTTPAENAA